MKLINSLCICIGMILATVFTYQSCNSSLSKKDKLLTVEDIFEPMSSQEEFVQPTMLSFADIPDNIDSLLETRRASCTLELPDLSKEYRDVVTLKTNTVIFFIKPSIDYEFENSSQEIIDSLNSNFAQADIEHVLNREESVVDTLILPSKHNKGVYVNFESYMKAYGEDPTVYYLFVFPKGTKFLKEIDRRKGIRTHIIKGSALTIPSGAAFIREEYAITGVASHEIAHAMGLKHIFEENGVEIVNLGLSPLTGDQIADTPAQPKDVKYSYTDKGTCMVYTIDTLYPEGFRNIIAHNMLGYTDIKCLTALTPLQINTMRYTLTTIHVDKLANERFEIDYKQNLYSTL